jgi:hypothetical protein
MSIWKRCAPGRWLVVAGCLLSAACGADGEERDRCEPDDFDGIQGGDVAFDVVVNDDEFSPRILTAQNRGRILLTLTNEGTRPLGFLIECLPTPNDDGCPKESCFPDAAQIAPIEPGETETREFEVPIPEGIYPVAAEPESREPSAQFVVK